MAGWLAELGWAPEVTSQDRGFAYYTRYFHGSLPQQIAPTLSPLGSISLLTIPGDGDTWSVTAFGTSRDAVLKQVRDPQRFSALVSACPLHTQWLEGEPLTGVLPMAGVLDRYRRFVVDGRPVVTGLVAVGDAWACTNPSGGRGLSVGLVHAQALRNVLREHEQADEGLALSWDVVTEQKAAPLVRAQEQSDRVRIAEMEALRDGLPAPEPDPTSVAFAVAAAHDAGAFRGLMETVMCLAVPEEVIARPEIAAAVERHRGRVPQELPGPSREQLVALLTR